MKNDNGLSERIDRFVRLIQMLDDYDYSKTRTYRTNNKLYIEAIEIVDGRLLNAASVLGNKKTGITLVVMSKESNAHFNSKLNKCLHEVKVGDAILFAAFESHKSAYSEKMVDGYVLRPWGIVTKAKWKKLFAASIDI